MFHFLRGTRHVDRDGNQFPRVIPKEQRAYVMVLAAFKAAEVGPICSTVHLCMPVGIGGAAVYGHRSVSKSPGKTARLPFLPRLLDGLGNAISRKRTIRVDLHDSRLGDVIYVGSGGGCGMRVRGV